MNKINFHNPVSISLIITFTALFFVGLMKSGEHQKLWIFDLNLRLASAQAEEGYKSYD